MAILWILRLLAFLVMAGGAGLLIYGLQQRYRSYNPIPDAKLRLPMCIALIISGFFALAVLSAATYVPATNVAVVENTTTGNFKVIGPGIHIWPLQPDLVPLTSKVTQYNMRRQRIEIGTEKESNGIASGSASPGQPVVYIQARGWVTPNRTQLIELHRRFGPTYADNWVERNWVTSVKAVQGVHPYDYLAGNRDRFSTEVEDALQKELYDGEENPLVVVTELAVTNFEYDKKTNDNLQAIADRANRQREATEEIEIAKREQEKQGVEAETRRQVAVKDGQALVATANAEAEAIRIKYENEQRAQAYLQKLWIDKWNGQLPIYQMGNSTPLVQIPGPAGPS